MALDLTTFDAALKELYTDQKVENLVYKNNPFLALVPKDENFYGDSKPIPVVYGNPQGRSASFSRAQTRGALESSKLVKFLLTRVKDYGICTIDNETLLASSKNIGAFVEAKAVEIDGIIQGLTRSLAIAQFKSGWGAIGQIGSISTTTITLSQPDDVTNFEVGQELMVAAAEATGATRAVGTSTNGLFVTRVDRSAGTITFGFNVTDATNGIPTAAANDFIFVRGDRDESASPVRRKVTGVEGWIPVTSPTSGDSFFGVDRSVDATRLAGQRFDGRSIPIEEALIEGSTLVAREGGSPDHIFLNYSKYADLEKALGSKVQYADLKVGEVAFRGIIVNGPNGVMKVIPDQNVAVNRAYILQLDTWLHMSLGKAVRVIDTDGLQMLRQSSADGVEVRYGYYANLSCTAPAYNAVVQI